MSFHTLDEIKADLRVTHASDDALLQTLLEAAEDEAMCFLNCSELTISNSITAAIYLLVRAKYDATLPDEIARLRKCAETLLMPYREDMGI